MCAHFATGGLEEAAVGSSVSGQQPRVSRLIMLLICLTATALFVLNISIIVCFLRRRALKRNVSSEYIFCACVYMCMYLVVVYRAWATLVWSCLSIYICPVFPLVVEHYLPLSPLRSVISTYLYFSGERCIFLSFKQILFCIFSCPLKYAASPFLFIIRYIFSIWLL